MNTWKQGNTYSAGQLVLHQGKLYQKADDSDQSEPDDVAGGWVLIPDERTNLAEYQAIEASFSSYEQCKADHQAAVAAAKASAEAKLKALGLTVEELQAIGLQH